jgi:chorismate dehydratase
LSAPQPLAGLRIGAVSYLNTKPLIWPLRSEPLVLDVPARLADSFYAGNLDVALLPIFEVLHHGGGQVADDIAIACQGNVYSVLVGSRTPFEECGEIYLDPSSRSSVALLRVLIAEYYPRLRVREGDPPDGAARLLIGDPAIAFHRHLQDGWLCHDLGALWQGHTGLPFVFAVWALRPGLPGQAAIAAALRDCKTRGLEVRKEIAEAEPDPVFALEYLTRHIRYDIGADERRAIELFSQLAAKHGLLEGEARVSFV